MMVTVSAAGFDVGRCRDMDHIAFSALYAAVCRKAALDAAAQLALGATAAQGDSKGIQKTLKELNKAGGVQPAQGNLADLAK